MIKGILAGSIDLGVGQAATYLQAQFISGGGQAKVALVQAGKADVLVTSPDRMVELVIKGQFRVLLKVADYLPKPWASTIIFAQRDFVKSKPDVAQRGVRAILEANKFILNNPDWAIASGAKFPGSQRKRPGYFTRTSRGT